MRRKWAGKYKKAHGVENINFAQGTGTKRSRKCIPTKKEIKGGANTENEFTRREIESKSNLGNDDLRVKQRGVLNALKQSWLVVSSLNQF